jgi:hypothetical protein
MDSWEESFTIYRPKVSSGRLELPIYRRKEWKPSLSYKHSLEDIRSQMTPSEHYRHRLVTSGKEIRMIQRLEFRWNRDINKWSRAATKIAALHRGNVGRAAFLLIKDHLVRMYIQRMARKVATDYFVSSMYNEAIVHIDNQLEQPLDLLEIKLKCCYRLLDFTGAIVLADVILGE